MRPIIAKLKSILHKEGFLFLFVFLVEFLICLNLIYDHRIPGGHDGFQYFTLQYYFLNDLIVSGHIPQWLPFMTQGTVATWWYALQASIFQNTAFLVGSFLKNINFVEIFNIGIFFDKLILLVGVWLLSRRFYACLFTVFFVSMTVTLSTIWMLQPWFNFHFYFAIPLILYFFHLFFEKGKWRYSFLAGNLLLLQILGSMPYHFPVVTLVIFLYFFFYFIFNPAELSKAMGRIRLGLGAAACLAVLFVLSGVIYYLMSVGTSEIITYNLGRNADQTLSLPNFLNYSRNFIFRPWSEVLLGISPALDYTLYMGLFSVPLIILGLIPRPDRRNSHFVSLALVIFLFSCGGLVASFFYYLWPMMKLFRHLSLLVPVIKLFLCFIAGFGLEFLFERSHKDPRRHKIFYAACFFVISAMLVSLYVLSLNPHHLFSVVNGLVRPTGGLAALSYTEDEISKRLEDSLFYGAWYLVAAALLFFASGKGHRKLLLYSAIAVHVLNLLSYNLIETFSRTTAVKGTDYKITAFQPMPFASRRDELFPINNPRENFLYTLKVPGVWYWSTHLFLFKDQAGNPFRTDHWLRPLDSFMRVYWGQFSENRQTAVKGLDEYRSLMFPLEHPASKKITGVTEDKIQFFSGVCEAERESDVAYAIARPEYKGDFIFLTARDGVMKNSRCKDADLSHTTRVNLPYKVLKFSSNNLLLTVDVPLEYGTLWMLYSDVWHPNWRATVNEKPVEIYKANLAYKAVKLDPGKNVCSFFYGLKSVSILQRLIGFNSLFWVGAIIFYLGKLGSSQTSNEDSD